MGVLSSGGSKGKSKTPTCSCGLTLVVRRVRDINNKLVDLGLCPKCDCLICKSCGKQSHPIQANPHPKQGRCQYCGAVT